MTEVAHALDGAQGALERRAVEELLNLLNEAGELGGKFRILIGGPEKLEHLLADQVSNKYPRVLSRPNASRMSRAADRFAAGDLAGPLDEYT